MGAFRGLLCMHVFSTLYRFRHFFSLKKIFLRKSVLLFLFVLLIHIQNCLNITEFECTIMLQSLQLLSHAQHWMSACYVDFFHVAMLRRCDQSFSCSRTRAMRTCAYIHVLNKSKAKQRQPQELLTTCPCLQRSATYFPIQKLRTAFDHLQVILQVWTQLNLLNGSPWDWFRLHVEVARKSLISLIKAVLCNGVARMKATATWNYVMWYQAPCM